MDSTRALFVAIFILFTAQSHAAESTCQRPDNGSFVWGLSPVGCDAQPLGDVAKAQSNYAKLIFNKSKANDKGQVRSYMTNMNALLYKMSHDYLLRREPKASAAEADAFARAIESVATQESYWTHYRFGSDKRLKLMTGDHNESLGMMQLHDTAHAARDRSRFDLVTNILLGIEQYYASWELAAHEACVRNSRAVFTAQARAAYSAYNGGPGSVCRFTDSRSQWVNNDKGFYQKFSQRPWLQFVSDTKAAPVDIDCAQAGRSSCATTTPPPNQTVDLNNKIVHLDNGQECFSTDGKVMYCAPDLRTFSCLQAFNPSLTNSAPVKIASADTNLKSYTIKPYENRDALCLAAVSDLALPGQLIRLKTDTRLLDKPDGKLIQTGKAGDVFQVVDYEVSGTKSNLNYRVLVKSGKLLWLLAGEIQSRIVTKATGPADKSVSRLLPIIGDSIKIELKGGVNFRAAASLDSKTINLIPTGTVLQVLAVTSTGGMGERWLQVTWKGQKGFVFSGHTSPEPDVNNWLSIAGK